MHVRCPHCHNRIELVDDAPLEEILCTSCGSSFNLVDRQPSTTIDFQGGKRIAHFELIEQLGMGAFGSVWRARDTQLDREVAVKIPRKDQLDPAEAERFLREARAAAQLRHPSIVQVHEVGREGDQLYIVSDLVRGATLADWLTGQRLTPRESAELCVKLAEALHHAHTKGVVHRDLKPGNIMLDLEGNPYLLDFGLAKREAGEVTMTLDGRVLGTPAYMSPEQARGEGHDADAKSDVYSMGVILFQLLTGELPFRGNTRMLLVQIQTEEPPSPRKLNAAIPRDLETITLKCLEKTPDRRYQTAQSLADELGRHLQGRPIHARPISRIERVWRWSKRQPLAASLAAAVFATLVSGVTISTYFAVRANSKAYEANENAKREAEERKKAVAEKDRADHEADAAWANQYVAHMRLLESDWDNANLSRMRETLELYRQSPRDRKDPRGWEWYYQERLCSHELRTLTGHTQAVSGVAFSPDGARVASCSYDGTVKLWVAGTGQDLRTNRGHTGEAYCVAFSADGASLASGGLDRTVRLWDSATGQELRRLKGHTHLVNSVAFSSDGSRLASGSGDKTVKLWDAVTGHELHTLKGHAGSVISVAFSPDGARVASGSQDRTVKLWDAATGQEMLALKGHTGSVISVAFSPDGARVASGSQDNTVNLWDAATGHQLHTLKGHTRLVKSVAFSREGARVASASWDNTVKLWDAATGEELRTVKGHTKPVTSVALSPDGARMASGSFDLTVKLWDVSSREEPRSLKGHTDSVFSVAFSPDGVRVASGSGDKTVKLWDAVTGHELHTLNGHTDSVSSVAFSRDGARVASGSYDSAVKLWDAATGQALRALTGHTGRIRSVAFSPDGARMASGSDDHTVKLWDEPTGQELHTLKGHTLPIASVAFSQDRARVASASVDGTVKLWDAATGHQLHTLKGRGPVYSVAFSPDGAGVVSGGFDGTVKHWDAATGQELRTLKGRGSVASVAFSPDGSRVAFGRSNNDRTMKLWDAVTGEELRTLKGHSGDVYSVAFSPDGARLASGCLDHTVELWDARPLTPEVKAEVEAVALLEILFARPLPQAEVRAAIERDKIIDEAARRQALKLAELYKEETEPQRYHDAAWGVVRHPYSNVFMCQFALAQMKAACERAPENASYRIGLAVAQYRLGKFENPRFAEALATLQKCDQEHPTTLAFLAMTQFRLKQNEESLATLAPLRELMKEPNWASDEQALAFLREAVGAIEGPPRD